MEALNILEPSVKNLEVYCAIDVGDLVIFPVYATCKIALLNRVLMTCFEKELLQLTHYTTQKFLYL